MRKIVLLFVVLAGIVYLSGCGDDYETCRCYHHYSGPGSEDLTLLVTTEEVIEDNGCSSLNKTTTSATGLITDIACVDGQ